MVKFYVHFQQPVKYSFRLGAHLAIGSNYLEAQMKGSHYFTEPSKLFNLCTSVNSGWNVIF
jgi:hypothetical protein